MGVFPCKKTKTKTVSTCTLGYAYIYIHASFLRWGSPYVAQANVKVQGSGTLPSSASQAAGTIGSAVLGYFLYILYFRIKLDLTK
jgi:hypothetical protein